MEQLLDRIKKDLAKLQKTIKKEGENLLQKIQELNLKNNFEKKKKQLEKLTLENLEKIEPICRKITDDISKKAKKAGVDLNNIEKKIKKASKKIKKTSKQVKKTVRKVSKQVEKKVSKNVRKKVTTRKETTKKTKPTSLQARR